MSIMKDVYGVPEMSMKEWSQLTDAQHQIVGRKLELVGRCDKIAKYADQIRSRAKGIPVLNDPAHAELVEKFAYEVARLEQIAYEAATYGIN